MKLSTAQPNFMLDCFIKKNNYKIEFAAKKPGNKLSR